MGLNSMPRLVPKDDASEGSTEYHAKSAAPHSSFQGEVAGLELEPQLSVSLTAQTERDQCIAQLTAKHALKNALLEQAEVNAAEAAKRAGLELREHADQLLIQTSLVKQRDVELRYMQAKLDELLVSRDQQIGQHEKELASIRAKRCEGVRTGGSPIATHRRREGLDQEQGRGRHITRSEWYRFHE